MPLLHVPNLSQGTLYADVYHLREPLPALRMGGGDKMTIRELRRLIIECPSLCRKPLAEYIGEIMKALT